MHELASQTTRAFVLRFIFGSRNTVRMRGCVANAFGTDILIPAQDPMTAAHFYVEHFGFEITDNNPKMIGMHGRHINLFIEPGPPLGPVLEVTVDNVQRREHGWRRTAARRSKTSHNFRVATSETPRG